MSVAKTLMSSRLLARSASSTSSIASVYASSPLEQAVTQQRMRAVGLARGDQRDDHLAAQRFPCLGIAEKPGHVDQQVVGQRRHLGGALPQHLGVFADLVTR